MTAFSKAAKRRAKKARLGIRRMYDTWKNEQPPPNAKERDDPMATVLQARARHMGGGDPDAFRDGIYCEDAGRAIAAEARNDQEATKLWGIFRRMDQAETVYYRHVVGKTRFPNVSKMEIAPERFETRADDRPDLRTEDEKHRDAVKDLHRWTAHLSNLASHESEALIRAMWRMDDLHGPSGTTARGKAFVAALRSLQPIVDGEAKRR